MVGEILADGFGSDVTGTLLDGLAGPLAAGARTDDLPISDAGDIQLEQAVWEPLLMLAPARDLEHETWQVTVQVDGADAPGLHFAPWSERAAYLPLHRPAVGPGRMLAADITVTVQLGIDGTAVPMDRLKDHLKAQVLSGSFGRLLYVQQAETVRVRRLIRQIAAARRLDGAEGDMLDRIGRELSVPRFADDIDFQNNQIVTNDRREPDTEYRRRLALYRPFLISNRRRIETSLNGRDGEPGVLPGGGVIADPFSILEEDNHFSIALKLVSVERTVALARTQRLNYLRYIRDTTLINPTQNAPTFRKLPSVQRRLENQMRRRMRTFIQFESNSRSMAPALARAIDRAAQIVAAMGDAFKLSVIRAQQDTGGSRYELGLAAEARVVPPDMLAELGQKIDEVRLDDIAEAVPRNLIAGLKAADKTGKDGAWLWKACGLRTMHPLSADRMLLSHFSTEGLVIDGDSDLPIDQSRGALYATQLLAANDLATNAALAYALKGGDAGWTGADPPWTVTAEAQQLNQIGTLNLPVDAMTNRLRAMGLPTGFNLDHFKQSLTGFPLAMFALLRLSQSLSSQLVNDEDAAWTQLALLLERLGTSGVTSAVLMRHTQGRLMLVVSAIALPIVGANLNPRRTAGFVWRAMPVTDGHFEVKGAGTQGVFSGATGIAALAVISYARKGLTDPFEYRVNAAEGVALSLKDYEFLMNTLQHVTPAGVQVNTWDLRRNHIALTPGAEPEPLPVNITRAFRPFRRRRFADAQAASVSSSNR